MKIAIIGGGLGGLSAGLALHGKGFDVEIYEQAPELGEVGAGVQLTPNGSRSLIALGLEEEILRIGTETTGKTIYLWDTAETRDFMRLGEENKYGAPYLTFHRADLLGLLKDAMNARKPGAIHLNKCFASQKQLGDQVEVTFVDGTTVTADVVIGADGIHSSVRRSLFGPDQAEFTGCMAWRGLVPAEALENEIDMKGGSMWLGPNAHIVTYPVRKGKLLNFIAMVDRDDWKLDGWNQQGTTEEAMEDFVGWSEKVHLMVQNISTPFKWALIVRKPLESWSKGRVTLLGDACHSTLPFLSQGANMSFEDGVVLARCLETSPDNVDVAFRLYEKARKERTTGIVELSAKQLTRVHNPKLKERSGGLEHIDREYEPGRVDTRYRWIYGYDAATVDLIK